MAAPPGHVHVSEREVAHRWPDGRYDDAAWEDCTMMSGVELARACHDLRIPATHAEGEALRADSGRAVGGGTNSSDLARALTKRYGFSAHVRVAGFANLWSELVPGSAAEAQGSMGAWPAGHRMRRFDPPFHGAHAVFVARMDDSDRVWWCDPLAPRGTYTGEWVSKADLKRFVDGLGGSHVIARWRKESVMAQAPITDTKPATMDVLPGAVLFELDGKTQIRKLSGTYKGRTSPYAAGAFRAWITPISGLMRLVLVRGASNVKPITIAPAPSGPVITKAAVDAAKAQGVLDGTAGEKSRIRTLLGL